jgi:hypothetical protein
VLGLAPSPERGRALSQAELVTALRRAGRRRQVDARATAIRTALASQQLEAPPVVAAACSQVVAAEVAVIASLSEQLAGLEAALTAAFCAHPDAEIVRSQPGLGVGWPEQWGSAAEHRLSPVGVRGADRIAGCPPLLRRHQARGATHHQALRSLANRLVGILHGCLRHRQPYDEQVAWPTSLAVTA